MPKKKKPRSPKDDRSAVAQRACKDATRVEFTSMRMAMAALAAALLFIYFLLDSRQIQIWGRAGHESAEAVWMETTTSHDEICTDADVDSNDGSCAVSNGNDDTNKGNNRVPQECSLVMAPSGISDGGWGVFTLTPRRQGQRITDQGDLIIHVPDPNPNHALKMRRLIWDYLWNGEGTYGHYEGMHVMSAASGFGSLANGVSKNPNLSHNIPFVDDAGLNRGKSPGAGAISHHHNYTWTVERNLDAGDELFVEYGAGWMKERGFEDTAPNSKFDVSLLRNVGYCLDNLVQGPSLIDDAGRGAFASRELDSDSVVAPVPLIALSRSSLEMIYESQKDASLLARTQLLRNYCIGHANSSLLLYPYSHGINLINHSRKPNVRLRWWDGSRAFFEKPFLELQQSDTSQLMLELVATRQIRKGEEIVLDYGKDWAKAWHDHVENWQPREDDINHVSAESMNKDDKFLVLRTRPEQQAKPYPADVFTSCYYQYSGQTMDNPMPTASSSAPTQTVRKWKTEMIRPSRNLRPCIVLKRDKADESYLYTVHVMNRPTLTKDERIPKGHVLIATHVPRHAIVFSDKTYTSDQHLDNAFRKEIGLGDIFPEQWKDLL